MPNFITIAEAIKQKKGSFVGIVNKVDEIKKSTDDSNPWSLQVFHLADASGEVEFLAWNDADRKRLELGHTYEFIAPWYKDKDGKVSIQYSKFGSILHKEAPAVGRKPEPKEVEAPAGDISKLPDASAHLADKIAQNTVLLMQIEKEVRKTVGEFEHGNANDQRVGLYVKLNFEDIKKTVPKS